MPEPTADPIAVLLARIEVKLDNSLAEQSRHTSTLDRHDKILGEHGNRMTKLEAIDERDDRHEARSYSGKAVIWTGGRVDRRRTVAVRGRDPRGEVWRMTLYAYDGASPFDLAAAKAHGAVLITGYIVGHPGGMDPITPRRVRQIHALGMGFLPNWERAADFFRTASLADCRNAGKEALAACRSLGVPDDGTVGVPFSFDYQVPASGFPRATDQLAACGDGMGGHYQPLGYGQVDLINYWAAHGLPGPHWLMGSTWRPSSQFAGHEVGSPHVALVQSHDAAGNWLNSPVAGTDINTVTQPGRLPAWWPPGSPYAAGGHMTMDADVKARFDQLETLLRGVPHAVLSDDEVPVALDPNNMTWAPSSTLGFIARHLALLEGKMDPAKLAAAIAAALPPGAAIDPAQVQAACEQGVRAVFADAATP
jgi:hypothetical protein